MCSPALFFLYFPTMCFSRLLGERPNWKKKITCDAALEYQNKYFQFCNRFGTAYENLYFTLAKNEIKF